MRSKAVLGTILAALLLTLPPLAARPSAAADDDALVLRWEGDLVAGPTPPGAFGFVQACWAADVCAEPAVDCTRAKCDRYAFSVPAGVGTLTLSARWPWGSGKIVTWIEAADGRIVANGTHKLSGYLGVVARLEEPAAGDYVAVIAPRFGRPHYEAALRFDAPAAAPQGALLPDLVTLPPTDIVVTTQDTVTLWGFTTGVPGLDVAAGATGADGCRLDESVEDQVRRCLRFSNAVGNVGDGLLDVRLAAGGTTFAQRVHHADGSHHEVPAGAAEWHATHAHWHNAAASLFTLRAYDPTTGALGGEVTQGRKTGFCFLDVGVIETGLRGQQVAQAGGQGCLLPEPGDQSAWWMGLTPGWYDVYDVSFSDQYLEITGLPDGDYAICSTTDPDGVLVEKDDANNTACRGFRLAANEVTAYGERPYHSSLA